MAARPRRGFAQPGILVLYDRLLHIGGLNATTTAAQTVGGSLSRYTGGAGNQIWVEIYTQIGTTATTITANYTNQGERLGERRLLLLLAGQICEKNRESSRSRYKTEIPACNLYSRSLCWLRLELQVISGLLLQGRYCTRRVKSQGSYAARHDLRAAQHAGNRDGCVPCFRFHGCAELRPAGFDRIAHGGRLVSAIADYSAYKQAFGESPVMMATLRSIVSNTGSPLFAPLPLVVPTNSVGLSSADSPLLPAPAWPWQFLVTGMAGRGGSWWIRSASRDAARSVIWLADFLVHSGGMSGTVTTEQTTGLPTVALSRYTNGDGIMAALIVYFAG